MGFAKNLKNYRKVFKLSQEKFAKLIGISRGQVANYEIEASEPSLTTLGKIANFFNVPVDSMLRENLSYIQKPIGCFYIKSSMFKSIEFSSKIDIYGFNYRFGAFKTDDGRILEFLYIGSVKQPIIKYLLDDSFSYEEFNYFTHLINAQLGWKFIDQADTTTYIVVDDSDLPGKYFHIYGNYMSGMKIGEIYQAEFLDAIKENFSLDEDALKIYLGNLYKSEKDS